MAKEKDTGELSGQTFTNNPRIIDDAGLGLLGENFRRFGDIGGVTKNIRTDEFVGGNQRFTVLVGADVVYTERFSPPTPTGTVALGYIVHPGTGEFFSYREVDWDAETAAAANLAANKSPARWDIRKLATQWDRETVLGAGFVEKDLKAFARSNDNTSKKNEFTTPPAEMKLRTKVGDVYELNGHRLVCGDSSDPEVVKLATAEQLVDMVFTDPPYGIDTRGGRRQDMIESGVKPIQNDELVGEHLAAFLVGLFTQLPLRKNGSFYVCYDWKVQEWFARAFRETPGWNSRGTIVWDKKALGLSGHKGYRPRYEFVGFGYHGDSYAWQGGNDEPDIWEIPRETKRHGNHPTPKPVELVVRALLNSTGHGQLVFDGCMGTGTTLVAADLQGRICYGADIEPYCVDVAVARWVEHMIESGNPWTLKRNGKKCNDFNK